MLEDTSKTTARVNELEPLIAQYRETIFRVLDTETKRQKGLRKVLFGILLECRSIETFSGVLKAEESAWRNERATGEGDDKVKPQIPGSYRTTKSAIIKVAEDGPAMQAAIRKNCALSSAESGHPFEELLQNAFHGDGEGFLNFNSPRYAGPDGDSLFFADYDRGKVHVAGLKIREARNAAAREKAAKVAANGLASGGAEVPVLSESVGAALNRFIQVVHQTHGKVADDDVVAFLDDAGKALREWIAEADVKPAAAAGDNKAA